MGLCCSRETKQHSWLISEALPCHLNWFLGDHKGNHRKCCNDKLYDRIEQQGRKKKELLEHLIFCVITELQVILTSFFFLMFTPCE